MFRKHTIPGAAGEAPSRAFVIPTTASDDFDPFVWVTSALLQEHPAGRRRRSICTSNSLLSISSIKSPHLNHHIWSSKQGLRQSWGRFSQQKCPETSRGGIWINPLLGFFCLTSLQLKNVTPEAIERCGIPIAPSTLTQRRSRTRPSRT